MTDIRKALEKLIERLDYVHASPSYQSVWETYQLRNGPYRGPKYADELECARMALAQCDWQPIETAPPDGTRILVGCAGTDWYEIAAHTQIVAFKGHPWREGSQWGRITYYTPTHWRPLPIPPSDQKKEG